MWYVYILKSLKDGTYYKGLTNNLERRLSQHNKGECRSTKHKMPMQLLFFRTCTSRLEARKLEKYFKTGQGRDEIKLYEAEVAKLADAQS